MTIINIFSSTGKFIGEIEAEVTGQFSRRRLVLLTDSPFCTPENLEFENVVELDDGWRGVITPPRSWGDGKVTCVLAATP